MKRWHLYLILFVVALAFVAYSLIAEVNSPIDYAEVWNIMSQSKKVRSDPTKETKGQAVPQEVLELRLRHQVRALTELENGTTTNNLPRGIYGFSSCGVASLKSKRDDEPLLEIHKHLDGIVYYVGYASKDDVEKYLARKNNFHILAYPSTGDRNVLLFEIPIDFVSKCEVRPSKGGYMFDLFVTAIPELFS